MQIAQKYIAMYVHSYKFSKIGLTYIAMYAMMISTKRKPDRDSPGGGYNRTRSRGNSSGSCKSRVRHSEIRKKDRKFLRRIFP